MSVINNHLLDLVIKQTGAHTVTSHEVIQTLWSGYGEIIRLSLQGAAMSSVIVKYVSLPERVNHPRGWNTDRSHKRKVKSYAVEKNWYRDWSHRCSDACRVAACYGSLTSEQETIIIIEDLDDAGFPLRKSELNISQVRQCLQWLAVFHATFMGETPQGLWQRGSYWHLATRPDEWGAMAEGSLKDMAGLIDERLNSCRYQTVIHGDTKLANFCFAHDAAGVAAVDFQYVGGGCGMKDVAYFLGSCLEESACEQWQDELLDYYFSVLKDVLIEEKKDVDWPALEAEWRFMFPFAWVDFYRFLLGWMPGHWKVNEYSRRLSGQVLGQLQAI